MCETKKNTRKLFSTEERREILTKTGGKCAHCGKGLDSAEMTVEHIFPVAKGGNNEEFNLVALCQKCNYEKANLVYNLRDFYTYILPEYYHQYEEELYNIMLNAVNRTKSIMAEDVRLYHMSNEKYMEMISKAARKNSRKGFEIFCNTLINIKYEMAYEAEAPEICKFIKKMNEKKKVPNTLYDNEYKIRELIKYGQVFTLRAPDGSIKGVVGMFNLARHNIEVPMQIQNLAEVNEMDIMFMITLFELSEQLRGCKKIIEQDLITDFGICNLKLLTFTESDETHPLMKLNNKIFNMPYYFRGTNGFIQCYTGDGERRVMEYFENKVEEYKQMENCSYF